MKATEVTAKGQLPLCSLWDGWEWLCSLNHIDYKINFFVFRFFFNVKIIHSFTQWSVVETSFISASKKEHLIISCITSRVEYVLYILQLCCSLTLQILHLLLKSGCKHSFCCKVSRAWTQTIYKRWLQPLLLCSLTVFWCPQLSFWPLQCSWTVNGQ